GIPALYLNDWPDRYIHTNFDVPANIDPTKLLRAGFIAAVSGYVLSRLDPTSTQAMVDMIQTHGLERAARAMRKHDPNALEFAMWYEHAMFQSLERFGMHTSAEPLLKLPIRKDPPRSGSIYRRNMNVKGPMSVFGYDYFADHYPKAKDLKLKDDATYEVLNFADGRRTTSEIRDALSAIYGPIPLEDVEQYLAAAEAIGIASKVNRAPP